MLNSLGYPEMGVLLLFGLFVFGPERLPGMAKELGKLLRQARTYGKSVRDDLTSEMGPEFGDLDLRSLNPKTFVRKHLFEDEPAPAGVLSFRPPDDVSTHAAPGVPAPAAGITDGLSLTKPPTGTPTYTPPTSTPSPAPGPRLGPPPVEARTRFRDPAGPAGS